MKWSDIDFVNGVMYLYRSKVSNDVFILMTNHLRTTLLNRQKAVDGDYVFPDASEDTKRYRTIGHWKLRSGEQVLQTFPRTT